jgi:hypothetical protein
MVDIVEAGVAAIAVTDTAADGVATVIVPSSAAIMGMVTRVTATVSGTAIPPMVMAILVTVALEELALESGKARAN